MPSKFEKLKLHLKANPSTWLITGVAGFIGSNLLETLLKLDQQIVGLDDFATGHQKNLDEVRSIVKSGQWESFTFIEGDIRELETCNRACTGVDYVLHQAALGSVLRSFEDPITTSETNIGGFLNMLVAASEARVKRFVYASSSSTYGDHPDMPKVEDRIGRPLSPYAVTKLANEMYAEVFAGIHGFKTTGLRYFNVFGPRQDPNGIYAAVIPEWFSQMARGKEVFINGDGNTSRDFCFVDNAIQANLLAATNESEEAANHVYNIACGEKTTLNELYRLIKERVVETNPGIKEMKPTHRGFRPGDVRHILADISRAESSLDYRPEFSMSAGLDKTYKWYVKHLN